MKRRIFKFLAQMFFRIANLAIPALKKQNVANIFTYKPTFSYNFYHFFRVLQGKCDDIADGIKPSQSN